MLNSVPLDGVPVFQNFTFGVRVAPVVQAGAGVVDSDGGNGQDGSLKKPPTPFPVPSLSLPRNRFNRPPDIGSIALTDEPDASIASGSFSSTFVTQGPGVVTPMAPRKELRVPEPTWGSSG